MGMRLAFDSSRADFSGISPKPLFLSMALQKAKITVDEGGTEVAAATDSLCGTSGPMPSRPREFNCNRPFLFLVREKGTGAILFMGRVATP